MSMRNKMIEEINSEVANLATESAKKHDPKTLKSTTEALVDALLMFQRGTLANEREAAKYLISKIENIIK